VSTSEYAAVVLAGGTGARMSGADKAAIELEGRSLLEHALDALVDAVEVVVVGDPVPTEKPVRFVREDPAYGGPAAALLTGLQALAGESSTVVVLAVDMPRVTPDTVRRLLQAGTGHDGATLVDQTGRRQLAMALDVVRLRAKAPAYESWQGLPLRRLLASLELVPVAAIDDEAQDVDTWADLRDLKGCGGT
jgi:molybdopterin-guanine dinucleotide biosynthesis protein A